MVDDDETKWWHVEYKWKYIMTITLTNSQMKQVNGLINQVVIK
jgi:hypothetical protein